MKRGRPYSTEELATIKRLFLDYVPTKDIAKAVRRGHATLRMRIFLMGLRRTGAVTRALIWAPPHLQLKEVRQMGEKNYLEAVYAWRDEQDAQLEEEISALVEAEAMARIEATDKILAQGWDRKTKIKALREAGLTLEEVGQIFGVSRERIRQINDPMYWIKYRQRHPSTQRGRPRVGAT